VLRDPNDVRQDLARLSRAAGASPVAADVLEFTGAGDVNWAAAASTGPSIVAARKAADEAITSDDTLSDDGDLVLAVAASTAYIVEGMILVTSSTGTDIKIAFTVPASTVLDIATVYHAGGAGTDDVFRHSVSGTPRTLQTSAITDFDFLQVSGSILVAGSAGNFAFQWAQNTSSPAATTARRGSWLRVIEIE